MGPGPRVEEMCQLRRALVFWANSCGEREDLQQRAGVRLRPVLEESSRSGLQAANVCLEAVTNSSTEPTVLGLEGRQKDRGGWVGTEVRVLVSFGYSLFVK